MFGEGLVFDDLVASTSTVTVSVVDAKVTGHADVVLTWQKEISTAKKAVFEATEQLPTGEHKATLSREGISSSIQAILQVDREFTIS